MGMARLARRRWGGRFRQGDDKESLCGREMRGRAWVWLGSGEGMCSREVTALASGRGAGPGGDSRACFFLLRSKGRGAWIGDLDCEGDEHVRAVDSSCG